MDLRPAPEHVCAVFLVGLGGFAGAIARWSITLALPVTFPWGTLAVNVTGSFLLGALVRDGRFGDRLSTRGRLLLATGVLSSFTTYSTFAAETLALDPRLAVANVAANYGLGLTAAFLGQYVAGVGE